MACTVQEMKAMTFYFKDTASDFYRHPCLGWLPRLAMREGHFWAVIRLTSSRQLSED